MPKRADPPRRVFVEFPIKLDIQYNGNEFIHEIKQGDVVKCVFCGERIILNHDTVFSYLHVFDRAPKVQCRMCGKIADAVYYANVNNRKEILDEWVR